MGDNSELEGLVEKLSSLSVLDMSKLKAMLEDKWGVKAGAVGVVAAPLDSSSDDKSEEEEATEFEVIIKSIDASKKIAVIKEVRGLVANLGLKEAKDLVEKLPSVVRSGVDKSTAEDIKKKLESVGCVVEVKGL